MAVAGKENAEKASCKIREDLITAGLVENTSKCAWEPSQQTKWLGFGFELDLQQGQISVPQEKIRALKAQLSKAVSAKA